MKTKKLLSFVILTLLLFVTCSCTNNKPKLYVANVGDYINDSLIKKFEKENNCKVVYKEFGSNEAIYQSMLNDSYDVVVVSDYMIDKLRQEKMIKELNFSLLSNYSVDSLLDGAKKLINEQCQDISSYFTPYFWGTVGILYRTDVPGLEDYVLENGLGSIFSPSEYRKGMYYSARDAICLAAVYNGAKDINTTDETYLDKACDSLINCKYKMWGEDDLKKAVSDNKIDLALVYSGDYLDQCYSCEINGDEINFSYYAPENTNIWIDGLVITSKTQNEELAYKFLDFFSNVDNQTSNALEIGYAPLSKAAFASVCEDYEYSEEEIAKFNPYNENRQMYKYVSNEHYIMLNDKLDIARSSK